MSEITDARLAEMLAGLEGVTAGPWDTTAGLVRAIDGDDAIPIFESRDPWKKHRRTSTVQRQAWHNRQHVARCDPDTIRSILTELQERRDREAKLVEALEQALRHIEVDETTHGRPFAAGNVVRSALGGSNGTE